MRNRMMGDGILGVGNRLMCRIHKHHCLKVACHEELDGAIPLSNLEAGDYFVVKGFGNNCPFLRNRLLSMGICPGVLMKILKRDPGGHIIIELGNARLGLGGGEVSRIFVEKKDKQEEKEKDYEDSSCIRR